jgi:hypothetical protein
MTMPDTSTGVTGQPIVDDFLESMGMNVDEAYDYIVDRTSDCRLNGYYPPYFHGKKNTTYWL